MTRYILIDEHSGYIWHDVDTTDPVAACQASDWETGHVSGFDYAEVHPKDANACYHVYIAPEGFRDIDDGQSREQIEAVNYECKYLGTFKRIETDETMRLYHN